MWGNRCNDFCYPYLASNSGSTEHLPPSEGAALIRSLGIKKVRLLNPDHDLLKALENTDIEVNLGIANEDVSDIALSYDHAWRWFSGNIRPYLESVKIRYITVGHEGKPSEKCLLHLLLPAMQNIQKALHSPGIVCYSIHVSTSVGMDVLGKWTSPLDTSFMHHWTPFIHPIVEFLSRNGSPLMVNVFFDYKEDSSRSLFSTKFDAMVDTFYSAMEKIGYPRIPLVVSSTRWPSVGVAFVPTKIADALAYNKCFMTHLDKRTSPKKPIDAYLFTLFNSKKNPADKLDCGLFDFNMCPVEF